MREGPRSLREVLWKDLYNVLKMPQPCLTNVELDLSHIGSRTSRGRVGGWDSTQGEEELHAWTIGGEAAVTGVAGAFSFNVSLPFMPACTGRC